MSEQGIAEFVFQICPRCGCPPSDGPCIMGNAKHAGTWPQSFAAFVVAREQAEQVAALRSRLERAEAALARIRDHGETHNEPCWALHKGDCADTMQEIARAALNPTGEDNDGR